MSIRLVVACLLSASFAAGLALRFRHRHQPVAARIHLSRSLKFQYAYGSAEMDGLIKDSYAAGKRENSGEFGAWWDQALADQGLSDSKSWIQSSIEKSGSSDDLSQAQRELGVEIHKIIKKSITKFSLDRGFEFYNVVTTGERQCLLQSVLIASMLQASGQDAGLVMVWANEKDGKSNNGHAAGMLSLANGHQILIDASEPYSNPKHLGLFLLDRTEDSYQFVRPEYNEIGEIVSYREPDSETKRPVSEFGPLDLDFVRSQFDFYRGERAPSGLLGTPPTASGLNQSETFLRRSVQECPENPLAMFSLARVYMKEKRFAEARKTLDQARKLYQAFGWTPPGVPDLAAQIK